MARRLIWVAAAAVSQALPNDGTVVLSLLRDLLARTGASRVTLRQGAGFPVVDEALAPGVRSIRDERTIDLSEQPVALEVAAGRQVVQADSRAASTDPAFQRMLAAFGGIGAQIVTPVFVDGRVEAILSVHQLEKTREWTDEDVQRCCEAAERIGLLL